MTNYGIKKNMFRSLLMFRMRMNPGDWNCCWKISHQLVGAELTRSVSQYESTTRRIHRIWSINLLSLVADTNGRQAWR